MVVAGEPQVVDGLPDVDVGLVTDGGDLVELRPGLRMLGQLGIAARDLLRSGEDEYKTLGLADTNLSDAQLIDAMASHPRLIERPILVAGDKAVIGRPPEKVLEILP